MEKRPFNLYTSKPTNPRFQSLVEDLSQVYSVKVHHVAQMPPPDRQRPTKQQLRTERAVLTRAIEQDRRLLCLAEPHAHRFPQELADIKADITRHEQRIKVIDNALIQEGGQADGC